MNMQKGAALYLVVIVLSAVLGIVLGLGAIFVDQLKISRGVGHSVVAFAAAEAGVEQALDENNQPPYTSLVETVGGATYQFTVTAPGPNCAGSTLCIQSTGTFQRAQRSVFLQL